MFDDNFNRTGDSLSLKTSCDLYHGVINKTQVNYTDNFYKIIRPMEVADEIQIKFIFENVIDIYFEHLYLFKGDRGNRETLFPEFKYQEVMEKFNVKNPLSLINASRFRNIVFVKLKQKS